MGYMSIKQTSEKWNLSHRWINDLCVEGRIPGAVKIGSYWAIPEDAKKPKDARIKTGRYERNGTKRALTLFEFCGKLELQATTITKEYCPDVVISSSTYPLDTYPAQKIAKKAGAKYIHEAHDLWPLTLIELAGWSKMHPFIRLLATAEHSALSRSEAVVGVAAGEVNYMINHGLQSRKKFTHIPNGVVLEDWEHPEPLTGEHAAFFRWAEEQGRFVVC